MAEKKVVRFDVSMDNPHCVDQLNQSKQLRSQVDCNGLDDAPEEDGHEESTKQEILYRLVRVLGKVDQVKKGAHALDLGHQDIPISERSNAMKHTF